MPESRWCQHCGADLPEGAEKCRQCGAPTVPKARPVSTSIPFAGLMLLALGFLSLFNGSLTVYDPINPLLGPPAADLGVHEVFGSVHNASGAPIAGVLVNASRPNATATTDAAGEYRLRNITAGYVEITFSAPGHGNLTVRAFLIRHQRIDVTLPTAGPATEVHRSFTEMQRIIVGLGIALIALGLLLVAGAVACYRRRGWRLALIAAILGLFAFLPISLLLGLVAIVLVARSRAEFRR